MNGNSDWLKLIIRCFNSDKIFYSRHARQEMFEEEFGMITDREIYESVCNGEIIETYPDDRPYPSVLLFGKTKTDRPLHTVCSYNSEDDQIIVITVYHPNPERWDDYRRRKK
jgi:hypothetical protein